MALSFNLRLTSAIRCSPVLPIKLSFNKQNFSDDAKKKSNLYKTLGLTSSASHREIKKAYYDLTFKYHPDKNENCEDAAIKFREVTEAYEVLGNYALRKKYDKGVPITRVKKIARAPINHKAEFQEFFDSRSAPQSTVSDDQAREIHDLGTMPKKPKERTLKDIESDANSARSMQIVVGAFILIVMYCCKDL